jgi:hypothetical protein
MRLISVRGPGGGYTLLSLVLLAVVTAPLLIPASPDVVFARRYGRANYAARYARYIARCKGSCGRKNGAIQACIGRARKAEARNCRAIYNADRALCTDTTCKQDIKSRLKLCLRTAGGGARQDGKARGYGVRKCSSCCRRTKGQGSCLRYFSSSRFYNSFRYRGRLNCYAGDGGTPVGSCAAVCEREARRALAGCRRSKDPACAEAVETTRQACLARCQPGSPSGAYLADLSGRLRARMMRALPWLVERRER